MCVLNKGKNPRTPFLVFFFFFRLSIPSISDFPSSNQIYLNIGEGKEIFRKSYFDISLSKSYFLQTDFFKKSEKITFVFFLSCWLNGLCVVVSWVGNVFSRKTTWRGDTGCVAVDWVFIPHYWCPGDFGWTSVLSLGLAFPNWEELIKCLDIMANIDILIITLIPVCLTSDTLDASLFITLFSPQFLEAGKKEKCMSLW